MYSNTVPFQYNIYLNDLFRDLGPKLLSVKTEVGLTSVHLAETEEMRLLLENQSPVNRSKDKSRTGSQTDSQSK